MAGAESLIEEGSLLHREARTWSSRWRIRWSKKTTKSLTLKLVNESIFNFLRSEPDLFLPLLVPQLPEVWTREGRRDPSRLEVVPGPKTQSRTFAWVEPAKPEQNKTYYGCFKGWPQSELHFLKWTEHTIYINKFLPPLGFEPRSYDTVSRWLIHYAMVTCQEPIE